MDINKFISLYWNYYLQLENDFFELEPYIALDELNKTAYSTKYLQLIVSVCGEIDTLCKRLSISIDNELDEDKCGIDDYRRIIMNNYYSISEEVVVVYNRDYHSIQPWKAWSYKHNPDFWNAYNRMKHHRDKEFNGREGYKYATQKNAVESVAALYVILQYWAAFIFARDEEDNMNSAMPRLKSNKLFMENWQGFYQSFMGQKPWFVTPLYLKYIKEKQNS